MTASPTSKQIAIVGAGICGLCTALGLAKQGHQVTVYERDDPLPDGGPDEIFFEWLRRGASQFRHPHAFLAAMSNLLTEQFPDLIENFWQAGARKVPFQEMLPPELSQSYTPAPEDEALWLMMCRRATMEMVLRRYALQQPNLTIASGIRVNAMVTEMIGAQMQITGLTIQARAASEEPLNVKADIVIDAAGRGSPFKRWFQQKGLVIKTESHDAGIVYYTRHYQFKPGFDEPKRDGKTRSAGDLGYLKYGVFPGSGGHFAVILCVPCIDTALHDAVLRTMPHLIKFVWRFQACNHGLGQIMPLQPPHRFGWVTLKRFGMISVRTNSPCCSIITRWVMRLCGPTRSMVGAAVRARFIAKF